MRGRAFVRKVGDCWGCRQGSGGLGPTLPEEMQNDLNLGGPQKQVIIYVGSHRDEDADPAILSQGTIGEDHMIFFAAYNVLPRFVAKKVDQSESVIVVGGPRGTRLYETPLDKIFDKVQTQQTNKLVIFSQGSTSIINEVHPIREKSSWGLYEGLRSRGLYPIIVPFTIDSAPRFLSNSGGLDDKHVYLNFHTPIPSYVYPLFNALNSDNHQGINRFLRAKWTENIIRYPHMTAQEMAEKIEKVILGPIKEVVRGLDIKVELEEL